MNIVTQYLEEADSTPRYQIRSHQRQITQTNTTRILASVGGFDQQPSPPESPPDSPRSSNSGSSSGSERIPMEGNVPVEEEVILHLIQLIHNSLG